MNRPSKERVARAARVYKDSGDAGIVLVCHRETFRRWCKRYDIEKPEQRQEREHREWLAEREFSTGCVLRS